MDLDRTAPEAPRRAAERLAEGIRRGVATRALRRQIRLDEMARRYLHEGGFAPSETCRVCTRALRAFVSVRRGMGRRCAHHIEERVTLFDWADREERR